jgi:hypothetical protein
LTIGETSHSDTRSGRSSPLMRRPGSLRARARMPNWKQRHWEHRALNSQACATDSCMVQAPGTSAKVTWVSRCASNRFRLSAVAKACGASCTLTMRPRRPQPLWNAFRAHTTWWMVTPHLSTCGYQRFASAAGAPAPPRITEQEALAAFGPDIVYYATRLRGASNEKAKRELNFQPRPLEWLCRT